MDSYNVKRLMKKTLDWSRYMMRVKKYPDVETYSKVMRDSYERDYRHNCDRFSTSVEDKKFFLTDGYFVPENFYPAIIVIADTDQYAGFWMSKEDIKDMVVVNGEITGKYVKRGQSKDIVGSEQHYPNGNFLGYYKRNRLKYQYFSIFVPKEITKSEDIISYFKSEVELCSSLEDCILHFNPKASFLAGKFSQERIAFYSEIENYLHYVGKFRKLLAKFRDN